MRLIEDKDLSPADLAAMRDYIDALATKCELERFLIWNHPEPTKGPFDGGAWMEIAED